MESSNNFRSIFLIIISTALGAFFGVTIKDLFFELNVTTIGFYRFFFGLILIPRDFLWVIQELYP